MANVSTPGTTVVLSGPFFTGNPSETFRENVRQALLAVAEEGAKVTRDLVPTGPADRGHLRDDIVATDRNRAGARWQLTAVVKSILNQRMPGYIGYATYIESGVRAGSATYRRGLRAGLRSGQVTAADRAAVRAGSGFKGYGMFRKGAAVVRAARKLLQADLTKGMN